MARTLYVSDLHLGIGTQAWKDAGYPKSKTSYPASQWSHFIEFSKWVQTQTDVDRIVFLGDVFDTWRWPVDTLPPTVEAIIHDPENAPIVEAIRRCTASAPTTFVQGNHDLELNPSHMTLLAGSGPVPALSEWVQDGQLLAEHGHRYAMICAEDPTHFFPIGYFLSRIQASVNGSLDSFSAILKSLDNVWRSIKDKDNQFGREVLTAVADNVKYGDSKRVVMPDGSSVSIGEVKDRYAKVWGQWKRRKLRHRPTPLQSVLIEVNQLGTSVADRMFRDGRCRVAVFGHTHGEVLAAADRGYVYANTGAWCTGDPTFVETDDHFVRLFSAMGGVPRLRGKMQWSFW